MCVHCVYLDKNKEGIVCNEVYHILCISWVKPIKRRRPKEKKQSKCIFFSAVAVDCLVLEDTPKKMKKIPQDGKKEVHTNGRISFVCGQCGIVVFYHWWSLCKRDDYEHLHLFELNMSRPTCYRETFAHIFQFMFSFVRNNYDDVVLAAECN